MNSADRATVLAGFNDDGKSKYTFQGNVLIRVSNGSVVVAASRWQGLNESQWQCVHEGSILSMDSRSSGFFSLDCRVCGVGTYAVGRASAVRTCRPCPYGALCFQSTSGTNGLRARGGFWGYAVTQRQQLEDGESAMMQELPPSPLDPMMKICGMPSRLLLPTGKKLFLFPLCWRQDGATVWCVPSRDRTGLLFNCVCGAQRL